MRTDLSQIRRRFIKCVHLSLVTKPVVCAWISTSIFILSLLLLILNTFFAFVERLCAVSQE